MAKTKQKENKQELLDKIRKKLKQAKDFRQGYETQWTLNYEAYKNSKSAALQALSEKEKASIQVPIVFYNIETILPREKSAIFASKPVISVLPRDNKTDIKKAKEGEQLLDYVFDEIDFEFKFADEGFWYKRVFGTAIYKIFWEYEDENNIDRPNILPISPFDFYVDPFATSCKNAAYVFHRVYKTEDELKALMDKDIYDKIDLKELEKSGESDNDDMLKEIGKERERTDRYVLYEYFTTKRFITLIGNKIIRDRDNPFEHGQIPFVSIPNYPVPGEFWGISDVELLIDLADELNTKRRQRLDNVSFALNRMWEVLRSADINEDELVSRPGGVIHSNVPGGVREIGVDNVTQNAYQEEETIKRDIQDIIGLYDSAVGKETAANKTATGIIRLQQAANQRFEKSISLIQKRLKDVAKMMLQLCQQFMTEKIIKRIEEDDKIDFTVIKPSEIKGNFDFVVEITSSITQNTIAEQETALKLYQMLSTNPMINQQGLLEYLLEKFKIKEKKKLLLQAQPTPQPETTPSPVPGLPPSGTLPPGLPANIQGAGATPAEVYGALPQTAAGGAQ